MKNTKLWKDGGTYKTVEDDFKESSGTVDSLNLVVSSEELEIFVGMECRATASSAGTISSIVL